MIRGRAWLLLTLLAVASLMIAACTGVPTVAPQAEPPQAEESQAEEQVVEEEVAEETEEEEMAEAEGEGSYLDRAMAGEFTGTTVQVIGVMVGEDEVKMNESLKPFIEATGIDVEYIGTKEFEPQINVRVDGGDPPDIADFPQPGFLASFARQGKVIDVSTFLDEAKLQENYNQGWLDMATMPGPDGSIMAGVWHRASSGDPGRVISPDADNRG
jgi:alpha-glucoside transport system substrate-binding protein